MGGMKDVEGGICMALCACGKKTVQTGHCVAFDPIAKHWTLIVWPVRPGNIEVYGIPDVCGCPICFMPARKEYAVGPEQMPKEALDHLSKLHAKPEQPKEIKGDGKVPVFAIADLPEAEEV